MNTARFQVACVAFLCGCCAASSAHASAWTQPESGYFANVAARAIVGGKGYFADGNARELGTRFTDIRLSLYGEYGLTDDITGVIISSPAGHVSIGSSEISFVSESSASIRYALLKGSVPVSVEAGYGYTGFRFNKHPHEPTRLAAGADDTPSWIYDPVTPSHFGQLSSHVGYGGSFGWVTAGLGARGYSSDRLAPAVFGVVRTGTHFGAAGVSLTVVKQHSTGEIQISNVGGGGRTSFLGYALGADYWFTESVGAGVSFAGAAMAKANAAAPVFTASVSIKGQ